MKIFDSMTQELKDVSEISEKNKIRLFVCGPTVYDDPHIGHARTYISFDIITRWLKHKGFNVFYLQNITDVDDKIINRAKERDLTPKELSGKYEQEYYEIMKSINVGNVSKYAKASDYIPEIIDQIKRLIKKGFAYETESGVYFEVEKFDGYGKLSKQDTSQMKVGARIEIDEKKKNPIDFALWKKSKIQPGGGLFKKFKLVDGDPMWKSPWGWGRPGWHIEDTAITEKEFGPQYEIHGGASELKFPHHEAEIAQEESVSGKSPMVKAWMHTGVLLVENKKMSKSLKNFIKIEDFIDEYNENILRFMIARYSYRAPVNYSKQVAEESKKSLMSIINFLNKISFVIKNKKETKPSEDFDLDKYKKDFEVSMDNDFNTPEAISSIFSLIKDMEPNVYNIGVKKLENIYNFVSDYLGILGIKNIKPEYKEIDEIKDKLEERNNAKENKNFDKSDKLRDEIEKLGYIIEDTPLGQYIVYNE